MKLIVEKDAEGEVFAYRVTERQFRKTKNQFHGEQLDPAELALECSLDGRGAFHMIFDLDARNNRRQLPKRRVRRTH